MKRAKANRFGLTRDIPSDVRREVRRRSGFGCVLCGSAIIQYHHFDPPFPDATAHRAEGITALCPTCHTKVTCHRISPAALHQAVANPHPLQVGYSLDQLEVGGLPTVMLGQATFIGVPIVIEAYGRTLLGVSQSECAGAPYGLSASFFDRRGRPIAEVVANEWRSFISNWDVQTVGPRTTIRCARGDIALVFRTEPPSTVVVERLHMYYKGLRLDGQEGKDFLAYLPDGRVWFRFAGKGPLFVGCAKGIVLC